MNRRELAVARFLLLTYENAQAHADDLDPRRRRRSFVAGKLDAITAAARDAFLDFTGRLPAGVSLYDLSSETPAPWARAHKAGGPVE
jgi:hypothetical protein